LASIDTRPPAPVAKVSAKIAPPLVIERVPAFAALGCVPKPPTVTDTSPPRPGPKVEAATKAPSLIARLPAFTITSPARPVLPGSAVARSAPPSTDNAPLALTLTLPPGPEPKVAEVIVALSVTAICDAVTATDPALPIDPGVVSVPIRDPDPAMDNR